MYFSILLILLILCIFSLYSHSLLIAIGIQGKSQDILLWKDIFHQIKYYHIPLLHIYFLTYDENIPSIHDHFTTFYQPNTTWTTGRNYLIREIGKHEQKHNFQYKYYMLMDSDMSKVCFIFLF